MAPRVVLVSAPIGEGHDLPARALAAALAERGADTATIDGVAAAGKLAQWLAGPDTTYDSRVRSLAFDVVHRLIAEWRPTHRVAARALYAIGHRGLLAAVLAARPDVVISTYPGTTEGLGRLRRTGRLQVPLVSAITDLASLRYWAHPGVDLHLITHPESAEEVRAVAGPDTAVEAVHGLTGPAFRCMPDPAAARARLALPPTGALVVVSGGGWAVGDLGGAVDGALAAGAGTVVVLCGRRTDVADRMRTVYAGREQVRVWGFTERIADLLAAADVLVHSTAGLTVLEAMMSGCRVISFGWGLGHIRANNRAYERFGLAAVAPTRAALGAELRRALAAPRAAPWQPALPEAADLVLALAAGGAQRPLRMRPSRRIGVKHPPDRR